MLSDLENEGGAAVAATRLAASLRQEGDEVIRVVARRGRGADGDPATVTIRSVLRVPTRFATPAISAFAQRVRRPGAERRLADLLREHRPDVVNIHNLHNAVPFGWSFRFVEIAAEFAPVVVTLHDMWSFTGRCAYNGTCPRFERECDASCPTADEYPAWPRHLIQSEFQLRHHALESFPGITAAAPSRWIAAQARGGLWRTHRVEIIPYGVDLSIFRPLSRAAARRELGIAEQARVILFAAHHFGDPRKGGVFLGEVLRRLGTSVVPLAMGGGARLLRRAGAPVLPLGWIRNDERKALAYNAADLVVHASIADNLPNVLLEAIACGTPAAAFDVGGVGEIIRPGVSGWLANDVSGAALARTVEDALRDVAAGFDLRGSSRQYAEKNYDRRSEVARYRTLFEQLRPAASQASNV